MRGGGWFCWRGGVFRGWFGGRDGDCSFWWGGEGRKVGGVRESVREYVKSVAEVRSGLACKYQRLVRVEGIMLERVGNVLRAQ